jgi:quinol-cytochrome oxidoreductase complex cytochrome b subunit
MMKMKIELSHWHHYFGGVALVLLILQLLTGIFLGMYYQAGLETSYASVQSLYKDFAAGALIRDGHRWMALFIFAAIIIHVVRSLLQRKFLNYLRTTYWLTGGLLLLPLLALLVTGLILPWEWRAYWLMEMVPNYLGELPLIGGTLKAYLIESFTLSRNLVAHAVVLPIVAYILIDFHILALLRLKKLNLGTYLAKHALLSLPFIIAIAVLAYNIPTPTEDPDIIPMPLEGAGIPAPEWFFLFLLQPYLNFEGAMAALLSIYLPLALFIILILLPYVFKGRNVGQQGAPSRPMGKLGKVKAFAAAGSFLIVVVVTAVPFVTLYAETHVSPTLGCNSCHNVMMGTRMGIPPKAFKDRNIVPLLDDNHWMLEHWFYPQVAW